MKRAHRFVHGVAIAGGVLGLLPSAMAESQPEAPSAVTAPVAPCAEPSSLELWGTVGPSVVFGEPANPEYTQSFRRVGVLGEVGVAYRSSYFVDPFLSVAYATLASGESRLPNGPWGAGGTMDQHLGAWVIAPGVTSDLWRFRLRFGLGLAIVVQRFEMLGQQTSSNQFPLANQLGVGFNALAWERFRLDAETRLIWAPGAEVSFVTVALVARGDLLQFGTR